MSGRARVVESLLGLLPALVGIHFAEINLEKLLSPQEVELPQIAHRHLPVVNLWHSASAAHGYSMTKGADCS